MFATLFKTWPKIRYAMDDRCVWYSCPYEGLLLTVLMMDDAIVASKKHAQFKTRVLKPHLILDQNGQNRYPIYNQNG